MPHTKMPFLESYLPYLLGRADQTLSAPFYEVLTKHGVARSEWRLLAVLFDLGELSVLDLSVASLSPQPTVTHALRRLEEQQLVTRTRGDTDRRQRIVAITEQGATLTKELISEARRLEAEVLVSSGDLSALVAELRELTARIEGSTTGSTQQSKLQP